MNPESLHSNNATEGSAGDRHDIPPQFRAALQGYLNAKQATAAELQAIERQAALFRDKLTTIDGQIDGLLSGLAISLGLNVDKDSSWKVSADYTQIFKDKR